MDNNHCAKILFVSLAFLFSVKGIEGRKRLVLDWKPCGGTGFLMTNITTSPNPIETPGKVTVSADIIVTTVLDNISVITRFADSIFEKKTEDGTYETLPCQGTLGGLLIAPCENHDFCTHFAMHMASCSNTNGGNQSCDCPLQEGTYHIPPSTYEITIDWDVGEYHVRTELKKNGTLVECLESDIIVKKVLEK